MSVITQGRIPVNNWPNRCRTLLAAAAMTLTTALAPASASAGILVNTESAKNCTSQVLEQPFKRWGDYANYTLVPGGNFESGAPAWTLSKAKIVSGNESFYVRSTKDSRSLSLGASGVATSRPVCVGLEHPTMRFFARNTGLLTSTLVVEVLVQTSLGAVLALPIGVVPSLSTKWQVTLPLPVIANLLPLLPNQKTAIAFRFRAVGLLGNWTIDDVFVDPRRR
jgi:hypothetical protein